MKTTITKGIQKFIPFTVHIEIESEDDALTLLSYLNSTRETVMYENQHDGVAPPKVWGDIYSLFDKISKQLKDMGIKH